MKKIIMILALTSSFLAVAGCASKACQGVAQPVELQPTQHDFKGAGKRS